MPAAFAVNAASFGDLGAPAHSASVRSRRADTEAAEPGSETVLSLRRARRARRARVQPRLLADTAAGLRYAARAPWSARSTLGTLVFVAFASMDNLVVVFLVERAPARERNRVRRALTRPSAAEWWRRPWPCHAGRPRRPAAFWLIGGVIAGRRRDHRHRPGADRGAGGGRSGWWPGAGNTADLVGTDTLLQQQVPAAMVGRAFGLVYGSAQLASVVSYALAGPLVALAGSADGAGHRGGRERSRA